jgi:serine/threonine-protein kinase
MSATQVHLRFGEMAIQMRLVTIDQVEEGLRAQDEARQAGLDRSLGAWLHDRGFLDLLQIEAVLAAVGMAPEKRRQIPNVELRALVGRGAHGAVYRAFSPALQSEVAVKVRASRSGSEDPQGRRFRKEAKIGVRLVHPHIVQVHDAGETRDYTYHILEFVDGQSLDAIVRNGAPITEERAIEVGIEIASALEYAARAGIVHRDIKPANILIAKNGSAKLCDLGLAKDLHGGTVLTADGVLLGSPFYLAPEYAREGKIDHRSDIYSLGVTLYHAATGTVPFPGKSVMEILDNVVNRTAADPRTVAPQLSEAFAATVLRMMAKDPADRYQSAAEAIEALRQIGGRSSATISVEAPANLPAPPLFRPAAKPGLFRRLFGLFFGKRA